MHGGSGGIHHLSGNRGSDLSEARAVTHQKRKSNGDKTAESLHRASQGEYFKDSMDGCAGRPGRRAVSRILGISGPA
jgi:hypothetical protein